MQRDIKRIATKETLTGVAIPVRTKQQQNNTIRRNTKKKYPSYLIYYLTKFHPSPSSFSFLPVSRCIKSLAVCTISIFWFLPVIALLLCVCCSCGVQWGAALGLIGAWLLYPCLTTEFKASPFGLMDEEEEKVIAAE